MVKPNTDVILIVGGGPVGLLLSLYLAQRLDPITSVPIYPRIIVLEKRPDLRKEVKDSKLSHNYNVIISYRGLLALDGLAGLKDKMLEAGVIYNQMINCIRTDTLNDGFGTTTQGLKVSIERNSVVKVLLEYIESHFKDKIIVNFDSQLERIDFETKKVTLKEEGGGSIKMRTEKGLSYDVIIGADGIRSRVGAELRSQVPDLCFEREISSEPYLTTLIPHQLLADQGIKFHPKAMFTVQPKSNVGSLILLPNATTIGATLNLSCQLENPDQSQESRKQCFHTMQTSCDFYTFITKGFPCLGETLYTSFAPKLGITDLEAGKSEESAQPLIEPKYVFETTKYSQFHHSAHPVLLLGDAAHSMPPTVGQGINCGFEDVQTIDTILNSVGDDWSLAPSKFTALRQPQAHAITKLSNLYIHERDSKLFELRLGFDIIRSILLKKLPAGFVQPTVNQLLSQSSLPYTQVLKARYRHFRIGAMYLLGTTFSLTAVTSSLLFYLKRVK